MKVMIVIPTYNERVNLANLVPEILKLDPTYELLIVDDNSPDGTGQLAEELTQRNPGRISVIHRAGKLGLGSAYREGFKFALAHGADYVFEMDADFSHDPKYLSEFIQMMNEYEVVIGSRYKNGISVVNWPLRRLILSWMATKYVRLVTGLKLTDCTTGYKCFSRKALEALPLDQIISNGYSFQIEVNFRLTKLGFKIGELPIVFVDRHSGSSK
ncbi:MAG: polyprenol monophosphomannose synthase, partial [bacterium]|nr:polyprenol monophosphomannose synthase [bacterium]